jgi:hypothetical protein
MARLRSLNLRLKFHTSYNTHPIVIKYKDSVVNEVNLHIDQTEQKETITFEGFSPDDAKQMVSCTLEYNDREVDIQSIASLQIQDNPHVANMVIKNCKDIHFNGRLDLDFSKHWFEHNILEGARLDEDYVHWDQISFANQEVFCVGDSYTFGHGVSRHETWPNLLDRNAFNFGSNGLSHDGCVKNVKYILQNSKHVKQIVCLLPGATRKLFEFEFLGSYCSFPISYTSEYNLPDEFSNEISDIKESILKGSIDDDWIKSCTDIIYLCKKHKVECWLSTWDNDMYTHIPIEYRLPIFPRLTTFVERASDGAHPHRKHYELFVKNIKPYIDKR